ncbi:MAG: hypothetical protein GTO62_18400, partial [Planctomycetales bacterium]|nr:hypothetical protein [Planctomycetales bacterium]
PLARWDSGHYREILVSGYRPGTPVSPTAAFLPLYPLIARPVAYWLGPDGALVAVSNVAALIGAFFLYAWSKSYTDPPTGFWCVILATAYPPAMFLSAGYSDGLFFLEVAMALWLLQRRRVLLAGCVSGLATGTRPTGLALAVVVLAWAWVHAARRRWPSRLIRLLLLGSVSVSGFL